MLEDSSSASEKADSDLKFWDYFNMEVPNSIVNVTEIVDVVPAPEQGFVIGVYSALLAAGAVGNVGVFTSLVRSRRRKSRVNLLMTHLVVADMIVTFIVIPLEIGWRTTNAWLAGNMACKFFLVLRAFGLYLSSNILVCISLDRFFAILYPLRLAIARKRSKMMLYMAWLIALLCSLPQSLVFRVMSHPKVPDFQQCVSFEAFANQHQELAYNVFCLCAVYFLPLMIITVCYACIFYEISKNSKENSEKYHPSDHSRVTLRRSDQRPLARARRRTLRMTVTIVTVFACCWLPYATMTLWYMLDRKSAVHVSARVQDLFFIMAVSNSCMDPLVYGSYIIDPRTLKRTIRKIFCIHVSPSEIPGITGPDLKTRASIRQPSRDTVHSENAGSTLATIVRSGHITDAAFSSVAKQRAMLCDDDTQTSRISTTPFKIHLTCMRHHKVRFEETSLKHSVNSEPIPYWAEHSVDERIVRSSRSCEVFVLRSP